MQQHLQLGRAALEGGQHGLVPLVLDQLAVGVQQRRIGDQHAEHLDHRRVGVDGDVEGRGGGEGIGDGAGTMRLPMLVLAALCLAFGIFAFAVPLSGFILPAINGVSWLSVPDTSVWLGWWNPGMATLLIVVGMVFGLVIYAAGRLKGTRSSSMYVGGELLTVDEVDRLLSAGGDGSVLGARNRALLEFLYATGARVTEAVVLDMSALDLEDRTALITGKGNKQRLVPVGRPAVEAIFAYLPHRMVLKGDRPDPGAVFLNARGQRLTRQGIWGIVHRAGERAGIAGEKVSPHVLRHSAATHMVEGGADLRTVQELLGHANISTTQVYTRVSPQHLYEVYVTSHPRGR